MRTGAGPVATQTGDREKGANFSPRAFCRVSFHVGEQHEQICNLKTSLRLLCGDSDQRRGRRRAAGEGAARGVREGGAGLGWVQ